jgi:hypothetical protein
MQRMSAATLSTGRLFVAAWLGCAVACPPAGDRRSSPHHKPRATPAGSSAQDLREAWGKCGV